MKEIVFKKIPSGTFIMGASTNEGHPIDKELPRTKLSIESFEISETTITNEQFKNFIDETGYITTAEKYGGSFVFYMLLDDDLFKKSKSVQKVPWWIYVDGADWKHPFGPNSNIDDIMDHPVVHVSFYDALAFCKWSNTRLPSEAEWEYSARAGSEYRWPWGDDFTKDNKYHANIWQGNFPYENSKDDGFIGTAPAKYYEPNNFGLYNVIGNVWEWCSNERSIELSQFESNNFKQYTAKDIDIIDENKEIALKGGSFLCHNSYCNRYRLGARNGNTANSTSSNCGFRVCR